MNLFEYTAKSAYLDSLKHIHEIESELRSLLSKVYTTNWRERYTKSVINLDELTRPFMIYTKCLKLFENKSTRNLPDFIYDTRLKGATYITEVLSKWSHQITYAQYLDIFQYMNNAPIVLPLNHIGDLTTEFKYLIETIQDNVNPYNIDFSNVIPNTFYNSIDEDRSSVIAKILQGISMRQLKYNDKKYTVLEDFIDTNYNFVIERNSKVYTEEYIKTTQAGLNAAIEFHELISKANNA